VNLLRQGKRERCQNALLRQIAAAAEEGNSAETWLHLLSEYRNLITHNAPLSEANGSIMVRHTYRGAGTVGNMPAVSLPLPNSPATIRRRFAQPSAFETFDEWLKATQDFLAEDAKDALDFSHLALFRLSEFARDAVSLSPVAPTPILITDKDVIRGSIKYG